MLRFGGLIMGALLLYVCSIGLLIEYLPERYPIST